METKENSKPIKVTIPKNIPSSVNILIWVIIISIVLLMWFIVINPEIKKQASTNYSNARTACFKLINDNGYLRLDPPKTITGECKIMGAGYVCKEYNIIQNPQYIKFSECMSAKGFPLE